MIKRTKLRKHSKNPLKALKKRADDELQRAYRREYPDKKCESCGATFRLMHHHIEKSQNNYTRYLCPANLIFLCAFCHNQIHFYNRDPVSAYSIKRGDNWKQEIVELRKQKAYLGVPRLKEIIEYYKQNKPSIYGQTISSKSASGDTK